MKFIKTARDISIVCPVILLSLNDYLIHCVCVSMLIFLNGFIWVSVERLAKVILDIFPEEVACT